MHLTIDIGNTTLKAAIFSEQDLEAIETFNIGVKKDPSLPLKELQKFVREHQVQRAITCSVREGLEELEAYLKENFEYYRLTPQTTLPITNKYESPETQGVDRLALATGAKSFFPQNNILIIDAGTCVTYDYVDAQYQYLGGSITPGLKLRFKSLHNFTHKLPLIDTKKVETYQHEMETKEDSFLGNDTESSMVKGVYYGLLHEMEGVIDQARGQFEELKVILTGGDAPYFQSPLKSKIFGIPNLVMYGLHKILLYNTQNTEE
jgi:type III pantothenate kinase